MKGFDPTVSVEARVSACASPCASPDDFTSPEALAENLQPTSAPPKRRSPPVLAKYGVMKNPYHARLRNLPSAGRQAFQGPPAAVASTDSAITRNGGRVPS